MASANGKTVTVKLTAGEVSLIRGALAFFFGEPDLPVAVKALYDRLGAAVSDASMGTGEVKKQAQDRKRAEASITTLERVLDNPASVRATIWGQFDVLPDSFMPAVASELARMRGAVAAGPDALRAIYRRNETRR